jgi:hypothetical protein
LRFAFCVLRFTIAFDLCYYWFELARRKIEAAKSLESPRPPSPTARAVSRPQSQSSPIASQTPPSEISNLKSDIFPNLSFPRILLFCMSKTAFFSHTEPDFQNWEAAVDDFKDRVPELSALGKTLSWSHHANTLGASLICRIHERLSDRSPCDRRMGKAEPVLRGMYEQFHFSVSV